VFIHAILYVSQVQVEYASVVWNSITSTDVNKLERIQQKFVSVCFYRFFPSCSLEKLSLHFLRKRKYHLVALFFRLIVTLNPALPSWKILAFVFLFVVLRTLHRLVFVSLINNVLLLCTPMLPTWWVKNSTYLQSERFLSIIFYNLLPKICNNVCS
jgi:hypothetical protein